MKSQATAGRAGHTTETTTTQSSQSADGSARSTVTKTERLIQSSKGRSGRAGALLAWLCRRVGHLGSCAENFPGALLPRLTAVSLSATLSTCPGSGLSLPSTRIPSISIISPACGVHGALQSPGQGPAQRPRHLLLLSLCREVTLWVHGVSCTLERAEPWFRARFCCLPSVSLLLQEDAGVSWLSQSLPGA